MAELSETIIPEQSEKKESVVTVNKWGREITTTTRRWVNGRHTVVIQQIISNGYIPQQQTTLGIS